MDSETFCRKRTAIKAEAHEAKMSLLREHHGECPKYKGHFDLGSFWLGICTGFLILMVSTMLARSLG